MPRLAVLVALLLAPAAHAAPDKKTIDALAADTLRKWHVPGVAVVVVRDDEVFYLAGHGVREAGKDAAVTPDTLFALASLTKAFTATALGVLVDEGKADWDDKVGKHLPAFRLSDVLADRDVTLRDLLCHRTGLARHDLLWYRAPWSLGESVKRMAHLQPTHAFRTRYEYCNLTYVAAGLALGEAAGSSWEQLTRTKLLTPLGMKNAAFARKAVLASKDFATPHGVKDGKVTPMEWYPDDAQVRASGSIKASARELAAWLRLNLGGGAVGGKRIVSAKSLREVHAPCVVVPLDADVAEMGGTTQASYALGWRVLDYRGAALLEHGGAADGLRARARLLPKQKTGFVLLCNLEETGALQALGNRLLDVLLGVEAKDWDALFLKKRDQAAAARASVKKTLLASRKTDTKATHALSSYAGAYEDKACGKATIAASDKGLSLTWGGFDATLSHFHYDTFLVASKQTRIDGGLARFELDRDGNVKTLHWLGRSFVRKR